MRVVVSGNPVAGDFPAIQAEVDEHQLTAGFLREHIVPDVFQSETDWLHSRFAVGTSVSRSFQVNML